jgi:carboxyl-terminal processing protease
VNKSRRLYLAAVLLVLVSFLGGMSASDLLARPNPLTLVAAELAQIMPSVYTVDKASDIPPAANLTPLRTFWEAREKVIENFVEPIQPAQEKEMITGAIRGMLGSLGDPYTAYMTAKEYQDFNDENQGHFEGIGAVLGEWEDKEAAEKYVIIKSVIPNNPADKAGVRPNDIILKVDGRSIRNVPVNRVVTLIRGPRGEKVTLTIRRGQETKDIPITRGDVEMPTLELRMLESDIGLLHLQQFNRNAHQKMRDGYEELCRGVGVVLQDASQGEGDKKEQFVGVEGVVKGMSAEKAGVQKGEAILAVDGQSVKGKQAAEVQTLLHTGDPSSAVTVRMRVRDGTEKDVKLTRSRPLKGLLFDLSSDPGGLLEQAIEVAGLFVDGTVVKIRERGGRETEQAARLRYKLPKDLKMVVLINGGSASASEIVAGAIQDLGRGLICGNKSFGKAKVQSILELRDGSAMRITTAKYLTPKNRDIGDDGIHPDQAFPEPKTEDPNFDYDAWHDGQVDLALKALKEAMAKA